LAERSALASRAYRGHRTNISDIDRVNHHV
jgi:hypothetical protein